MINDTQQIGPSAESDTENPLMALFKRLQAGLRNLDTNVAAKMKPINETVNRVTGTPPYRPSTPPAIGPQLRKDAPGMKAAPGQTDNSIELVQRLLQHLTDLGMGVGAGTAGVAIGMRNPKLQPGVTVPEAESAIGNRGVGQGLEKAIGNVYNRAESTTLRPGEEAISGSRPRVQERKLGDAYRVLGGGEAQSAAIPKWMGEASNKAQTEMNKTMTPEQRADSALGVSFGLPKSTPEYGMIHGKLVDKYTNEVRQAATNQLLKQSYTLETTPEKLVRGGFIDSTGRIIQINGNHYNALKEAGLTDKDTAWVDQLTQALSKHGLARVYVDKKGSMPGISLELGGKPSPQLVSTIQKLVEHNPNTILVYDLYKDGKWVSSSTTGKTKLPNFLEDVQRVYTAP